jgi:hypothetical protein
MTREEFAIIWHDWLRGVSLIALVLLLVALHFLHLFEPSTFALIVVSVFLVGGFGMAASVCLSGIPPLPVRLLAPLAAVAGAVLAFIAVRQAVLPEEPYATATISGIEPVATLTVPTDGLEESYLVVRGRPGANPTGRDKTVKARLHLAGDGLRKTLSLELFTNKETGGNQGKKGPALGLRDADAFLLEGLKPGTLEVRMADLEPETALPMQLSLHWPLLPPSLLRHGLYGVLALAFLLALAMARRNHFPFILPYAMVLVVTVHFVVQGIPPRQPLLPLLGIVIGGGIGGSGVGYGLGKLLQLLLRRRNGPGRAAEFLDS